MRSTRCPRCGDYGTSFWAKRREGVALYRCTHNPCPAFEGPAPEPPRDNIPTNRRGQPIAQDG